MQNVTGNTKYRGSDDNEYLIYLACSDDGKGGDITNNNKPLKTYDEWLNSQFLVTPRGVTPIKYWAVK